MTLVLPQILLDRLIAAERIVAFTGAGMSAESGVPTFRGSDGIWSKFRPDELASMDSFLRNPALVWEWYSHRRRIIEAVQPHAGHVALARLESLYSSMAVVTQNIDNLHRRAGSRTVYELHGNIERNYCRDCGARYAGEEVPLHDGVPSCPVCGGLIRPDVVWFGEVLPEAEWAAAVHAAETADLLMSIGTSGVVYPAAMIPGIAKGAGAFVVEINPESTPMTESANLSIGGTAAGILPLLAEHVGCARRAGSVSEGEK